VLSFPFRLRWALAFRHDVVDLLSRIVRSRAGGEFIPSHNLWSEMPGADHMAFPGAWR
jgi:hypothetical protein